MRVKLLRKIRKRFVIDKNHDLTVFDKKLKKLRYVVEYQPHVYYNNVDFILKHCMTVLGYKSQFTRNSERREKRNILKYDERRIRDFILKQA